MSWNPVLNFVLDIKSVYKHLLGSIPLDPGEYESCVKRWIDEICTVPGVGSSYKHWQDMAGMMSTNQHGNLVLFRYDNYYKLFSAKEEDVPSVEYDAFWDLYGGFFRECRSVVIDVANDQLVLTPFRKFFNLNEREETGEAVVKEKISKARCVEFSDKLDGSMQSARCYHGKIVLAGSQALDPANSFRLAEGYEMLLENPTYVEMITDYPFYTFIFEFISLNDTHVVKYTEERQGLYLIGIRNVLDGEELPYKTVTAMAMVYGVRTTSVFNKTLEEVMSELDGKKSDEAEGFVINIDGWKVKLKYNDYVFMHKALSKIASVNFAIRAVADGTIDDVLAKLPTTYRGRVLKVANACYRYVEAQEAQIREWYNRCPMTSKKEFMIWVDQNVPKRLRGYVRAKYNGQPYNLLKHGNDQSPSYIKISDMGYDVKTFFTEDADDE